MTALIHAHGIDIDITATGLHLRPHGLAQALGTKSEKIPASALDGISITRPSTRFDGGEVHVQLSDGSLRSIAFPPRFANEQRSLVDQVELLLGGDGPLPRLVPGLNFVALDVETANDDWGSICQVGVVRFSDGDIVDTAEWLCTPPPGLERFDEFNIAIHGITADKVASAPTFAEILPQVLAFIGELPVVAHNAQFDMTALSRATRAAKVATPQLVFGCSLAAARGASLPIENHKLPTVARYLDIAEFQHHDALADAKACGRIIVELARRDGFTGDFATLFDNWGLRLGSLSATKVNPVLRNTMRLGPAMSSPATSNTQPAPASLAANDKASAPHSSSSSSRARSGASRWSKAAAPGEIPETNTAADPGDELFAQTVVLTGDFAPFDKGLLWQKMAERGAIIGKGVTKKTTMLVIGPWDSITGKQKRAEELIAKGQDITIWTAEKLFEHLGLNADEQPPF